MTKLISIAVVVLELFKYIANEILYHNRSRLGYLFETFLANQLADGKYGPKRSRIIANFVFFTALRSRNKKLVSWSLTHFGDLLDLSKVNIQDQNYISLVASNSVNSVEDG